jgi:hypothetical protein
VDMNEVENQFIRQSERIGGKRLMWITLGNNDASDAKIEFDKDFDRIVLQYQKQVNNRFQGLLGGLVKPKIIQVYTEKIKFIQQINVDQEVEGGGGGDGDGDGDGEYDSDNDWHEDYWDEVVENMIIRRNRINID